MNAAWEVLAVAGWAVLVLNLLLTLRLVRWLRSYQEADRLDNIRAELPELPVGEPAPAFQTRDLDGRVVTSGDYRGREIALIFVSPQCSPCRQEMPGLVKLTTVARQAAGAEIVLVSGGGTGETGSWLTAIREDDKVDVTLPVLVAAARTSEFQARYNPRGLNPYFCHIDKTGIVTARGGLHSPAWAAIVRKWDHAAHPGRDLRRYR